MSDYDCDSFNIQMAGLEIEEEYEYWAKQEEEDNKRIAQFEEQEMLRNAKKTCTFCKKKGHVVYQMGILVCPLLIQTKCNICGLLGHTPKFCIQKKEKTEEKQKE